MSFSGGRPGDWTCGSCSAHNFASRTQCFKCSEPKAASAGGDSGGFGSSGNSNSQGGYGYGSSNRGSYNSGGDSYGSYNSGGQRNSQGRPGDWNCGSCNAHNFASRTQCFKCREPKAVAAAAFDGGSGGSYGGSYGGRRGGGNFRSDRGGGFSNSRGGGGYGNDSGGNFSNFGGGGGGGFQRGGNQRPGDWTCASCSAHNFASRMQCFKCSEPKPVGGGGEGGYNSRGGYGSGYNSGGGYQSSSSSSSSSGRPGDWDCPDCQGHNFASRTECFKCHKPKPDGAGNGSGGGYSGGSGYGGSSSFGRSSGGHQGRAGDWNCNLCNTHNFASRSKCYSCEAPKGEEPVDGGDSAGDDNAAHQENTTSPPASDQVQSETASAPAIPQQRPPPQNNGYDPHSVGGW